MECPSSQLTLENTRCHHSLKQSAIFSFSRFVGSAECGFLVFQGSWAPNRVVRVGFSTHHDGQPDRSSYTVLGLTIPLISTDSIQPCKVWFRRYCKSVVDRRTAFRDGWFTAVHTGNKRRSHLLLSCLVYVITLKPRTGTLVLNQPTFALCLPAPVISQC